MFVTRVVWVNAFEVDIAFGASDVFVAEIAGVGFVGHRAMSIIFLA